MTTLVSVSRGAVYLTAETCSTYFNGIDAAALLIRDGALHVLPVSHVASGGALLKIRNSSGDRVVAAPDLFAEHGLTDWQASDIEAHWSSNDAALVIPLPGAQKLQTKFAK